MPVWSSCYSGPGSDACYRYQLKLKSRVRQFRTSRSAWGCLGNGVFYHDAVNTIQEVISAKKNCGNITRGILSCYGNKWANDVFHRKTIIYYSNASGSQVVRFAHGCCSHHAYIFEFQAAIQPSKNKIISYLRGRVGGCSCSSLRRSC